MNKKSVRIRTPLELRIFEDTYNTRLDPIVIRKPLDLRGR
jgi:hypothetical protein